MKRYLAFHNEKYYPSEGMEDCIGAFSRKEDAIAAVVRKEAEEDTVSRYGMWYNFNGSVFDLEQWEEVWNNPRYMYQRVGNNQ